MSVRFVETSSHVSTEGRQTVFALQAVHVWDRQATYTHKSVHNLF